MFIGNVMQLRTAVLEVLLREQNGKVTIEVWLMIAFFWCIYFLPKGLKYNLVAHPFITFFMEQFFAEAHS